VVQRFEWFLKFWGGDFFWRLSSPLMGREVSDGTVFLRAGTIFKWHTRRELTWPRCGRSALPNRAAQARGSSNSTRLMGLEGRKMSAISPTCAPQLIAGKKPTALNGGYADRGSSAHPVFCSGGERDRSPERNDAVDHGKSTTIPIIEEAFTD